MATATAAAPASASRAGEGGADGAHASSVGRFDGAAAPSSRFAATSGVRRGAGAATGRASSVGGASAAAPWRGGSSEDASDDDESAAPAPRPQQDSARGEHVRASLANGRRRVGGSADDADVGGQL